VSGSTRNLAERPGILGAEDIGDRALRERSKRLDVAIANRQASGLDVVSRDEIKPRPKVVVLRAAYLYGVEEGDSAWLTAAGVRDMMQRVRYARQEGKISPASAREELSALRDAQAALRKGDKVGAVLREVLDYGKEQKKAVGRKAAKAAKAARKRQRPKKRRKR